MRKGVTMPFYCYVLRSFHDGATCAACAPVAPQVPAGAAAPVGLYKGDNYTDPLVANDLRDCEVCGVELTKAEFGDHACAGMERKDQLTTMLRRSKKPARN